MEPSLAQAMGLTIVKLILEWAQLKEPAMRSIMDTLGFEDDDHPRSLAALSDTDWDAFIASWKIGEVLAAPAHKAKAVVAMRGSELPGYGSTVREDGP